MSNLFALSNQEQEQIPARFAPVVPREVARRLAANNHLGDYHLLLAHDVLAHPDEYKEIYADKGYDIIMDNSLIELGYPMEPEHVLKAAQIVGAKYAVLPDYLGDAAKTLEVTQKAVDQWDVRTSNGISLLGVVQGATYNEVCACVDRMLEMGVDGLCIPRVIAQTLGTRFDAVRYATQFTKVHLLGFSDDIYDDLICARQPNVIGIDSAVPVRMGLRGIILNLKQDQNPGPRGNYWDNPFEFCTQEYDNARNMSITCANLHSLRHWIQPHTRLSIPVPKHDVKHDRRA